MIEIGSIIDDRYEILKEIGRGGMSIVYLAMDNRLKKSVVVKDIRKRDNIDSKLLLDSLNVEANMLKKLDHGALPKIYDIIESEGAIYVVMDYIEGESLKDKLRREGKIPPEDVIDWAKQLADVLDYLHTRRPPIIYRDMKPDNIMLTPEGKIKLIDFGIAREFKAESTTDTTNLGTKAYAAPEQISGRQTDARTDIYSLGVTLYHLVTGKSLQEPPFELKPIRYWDPSLPEGLEYIIEKCTKSEPNERYQSCRELAYDLENINKLTKGYKKQLVKKLAVFLIPVVLCLGFSGTSLYSYKAIKAEKFDDYMNLINESAICRINGDEAGAVEFLEKAIRSEKKRPEAYMYLLDFYISKNRTDEGLAKIEAYMADKYGNIHKNDELLFKVGLTYFDIKKDYFTALKYFQEVNERKLEDVKYYKSLAVTLSHLNVDMKKFTAELEKFEKYNDTLPNDARKIDNYNILANIYLSYKGKIDDANTRAIEIIEKATRVLDLYESDESLRLKYELSFNQKLAQAYYSRAVTSDDKRLARIDFLKAAEHYQLLLEMDVPNKAEIMTTIGVIYNEMDEPSKAIRQLEETISTYPDYLQAYVKLAEILLAIEQNKPEDRRNFERVKNIYNRALKLEGAEEDIAFQKLTRRMQNFGLI